MGLLSFVGGLMQPGAQKRGGQIRPDIEQRDTQSVAPFGSTGTVNYRGYLVPSEYNADLTRIAALDVYERMRRSDPAVRETLMHIFAPIQNASWSIEAPVDPDDTEREITEFVRCAFFEWMQQPWSEALTHALSYLTFGHAVMETEFQVVTRQIAMQVPGQETDSTQAAADVGAPAPAPPAALPEIPVPPAPELRRLEPRQFQTWRRFAPRLPRTLWQWHTNESGELTSVTQMTPVTDALGNQTYELLDLPAGNLIVLTHEKWGDEFTGISLLRSAYKPWIFKEMLEKIAGIAYERYGVGIPIAYIPREHAQDPELAASIETALQNLGSGEQTYIVFPGPKQGGSAGAQSGYLLEIVSPQGGIPDFEGILRYFRSEIKGSMLVRFSEMGAQSGGNRATTDSLMEVYYNALHAVAKYVCETWQPAIRRLVDLNYPGVQRYPKLTASGIEARNLLEFSQALALLSDAGFLSADDSTRAWVRDEANAPQEDSTEAQARMKFDAELQRAKSAKPDTGIGGASRSKETDNPSETARPRAENAK